MDGKSLPHFPDELRVRIGSNCVDAGIGLLSAPFARATARSIGPQGAGSLSAWATMTVKPKIQGEES